MKLQKPQVAASNVAWSRFRELRAGRKSRVEVGDACWTSGDGGVSHGEVWKSSTNLTHGGHRLWLRL
jgi:hypothetical protein